MSSLGDVRRGTPIFAQADDGQWREAIAAGPINGATKGRYAREGGLSLYWRTGGPLDRVPESRIRVDDRSVLPEGDDRQYLNLSEAARVFSVSYDLLHEAAQFERMPSIRPSRAYLLKPRDVVIYLNELSVERRIAEGR